ncbi:MAG: HAMP domain-containing protein [Phyllobacteriaceae bacterium]|nr:HAMP domain-containing protein [Phyllobacteriaceae bacterium]
MASVTDSRRSEVGAPETSDDEAPRSRPRLMRWLRMIRLVGRRGVRAIGTTAFSSLARRIVLLNLTGLVALVLAILYLNQFRAGLTDARIESLLTQGEIIAAAIGATTQTDTKTVGIDLDALLKAEIGDDKGKESDSGDDLSPFEFPIDPMRVAPILRRLVSPAKTPARVWDRDGFLLLDSRTLYRSGGFFSPDLVTPPSSSDPGPFHRALEAISRWMRGGHDLPVYRELGISAGKDYPEVAAALQGQTTPIVRVTKTGEMIVTVAVPIRRGRTILGALQISTPGGDIDAIVRNERMAILRVFLVAALVIVILSLLLAGTIAAPLRRLAAAADRVRRSVKAREEIPDFSERSDEIGHLSRALRDMTSALYGRLEAIESFAADVAHELKNPLTSLRSAVETLPLAKNDKSRARLVEIVQHDVKRLDRLITDISDASRLDAELARQDSVPVDLQALVEAVVSLQNDIAGKRDQRVSLVTRPLGAPHLAFVVMGHDGRLGQVVTNLVDNARSFSENGAEVRVELVASGGRVEITIDDDGPGIRAEKIERIFERFYTDRPEAEGFGNNSGLGLAISKQIVEAHGGRIRAENRRRADGEIAGARFVVSLPAGAVT